MADRKIELDILARDRASRDINKVADAADDAGRELDETARAANTLDRKMDEAADEVRRLAREMAGLDAGSARFKELNREFNTANRQLGQMSRLRKSLGEMAGKDRQTVHVDVDVDTDRVRGGLLGKLSGLADAGVAAGERLGKSIGAGLSATGPYVQAGLIAAGVGAAIQAAPVIGAALTTGILGALGGGALAAGIAAAASSPKVKAAFGKLSEQAKQVAADFGKPFQGPLVRAAHTFGEALKAVTPQLMAMGKSMAPIIDKLAPALAQMATNALPGILKAVEASKPFFDTLAKQLPEIGFAIGNFFATIARSAPAANQFFGDLLLAVEGLIIVLGKAIAFLANTYASTRAKVLATVSAVKSAWTGLTSFLSSAASLIGSIPGKVSAALSSLPSRLAGIARRAFTAMAFAVGFGIGTVIRFVASLPGRVASLVSSTWARARSLFSAGVAGVVRIVATLPGRVVAFVATLPGRVASLVASTWVRARSLFSSGVAGVVAIVSRLPGRVVSYVATIPGRIAGLAGSAGGAAAGVGRAIISGLIGGIRSMAGAAVAAARDAVASAVAGAKAALGIRSPSRVFAKIGEQTIAGYAAGVAGSARLADQAVAAAMPTGAAGGLRPVIGAGSAAAAAGRLTTINLTGPVHLHGVQDPAALVAALQAYVRRNGPIRAVALA